jgi:hypothetical protein
MLVLNTQRSRLPGVFITGESRLPGVFTTGKSGLPSIFTIGESRHPSVFITGESFWTPWSHFTDFKEHTTIFKGIIILKIDHRLLNYLEACDLCLEKLPYPRDSNWLPVYSSPGSQLWIRITPRILEEIRNHFLCILGPGEVVCLKNRSRKISWHCPFNTTFTGVNMYTYVYLYKV